MSGRTDIWAAVIPAVPNSLIGAGFESFWINPRVSIFKQKLLQLGWDPRVALGLNEAHNGYIEVYLNLGWIGVCLLALILISGYRRAVKVFERDHELGSLFLAYVAAAVFYSLTEVGFRMLNPCWIFLLLAIVSASGVTAGFVGGEKRKVPGLRRGTVNSRHGVDQVAAEPRGDHSLDPSRRLVFLIQERFA
jgi:O-antigen ligase